MYSVGIAYLLWLLSGFGALGFHRFYLKKIPTGLLWIMTGGLGMIGAIYDFFTLSQQVRDANIRDGYLPPYRYGYPPMGQSTRPVRDARDQYTSGNIRPRGKASLEKTVLRLAKSNKGYVTPSEVALEGDISLDDAKKELERMASEGYAELKVSKSGVLIYVFPEFAMDREKMDFEEF